jgi:hypothetical protein
MDIFHFPFGENLLTVTRRQEGRLFQSQSIQIRGDIVLYTRMANSA